MSKLVHVQVLRAFAALAIACLHAQADAADLAARAGLAYASLRHLPWEAGVDVFFVISGFIMVYASRGAFGREGARRSFLARRIGRVVPLYWAVTSLFLAVALVSPHLLNGAILEPWPVLASYLFIPFERPNGLVQPLYSLGWTLNYEMFFYALFALVIVWPMRRAVGVLIAVLCGLVAAGALLAPLPQPWAFWTDSILLEFAAGMALGTARADGFRLPARARVALAVAAVAALAFIVPDLTGTGLPRALLYGVPAAALVAASALGRAGHAGETRLTRLGETLGDASYALYLVHPFVMRAAKEIVWRLGLVPVIGPWGYVALVLACACVVSILVYAWFERPLTALARRLLEAPRPDPAPAR